MLTKIKKRNGTYELFDPEKLNKWAEWASDINGVEWASIALDAVKKCYDGCTTSELQSAMITACIDREDEAHMYMAGRLYAGDAYKTVFGEEIPKFSAEWFKLAVEWGSRGLARHLTGYTKEFGERVMSEYGKQKDKFKDL